MALALLVPFSHLFLSNPSTTILCKVHGRGRFPPPTVSHSHEGTGKPRKTCADTVGYFVWDLIFVIDISITKTNPQSSNLPLNGSMRQLAHG